MVENSSGHKGGDSELPAPLTPADCDLRGLEFMPLYGDKLFASATWIAAKPEAKVAALRLWFHSYAHECPAASLPDDDAMLAQYAGYGVAIAAWRKVRGQALRGWIKCADGRLYHNTLAEIAIESWNARKRNRDRQRAFREKMRAESGGVTPPVTVTSPSPPPLGNGREDTNTNTNTDTGSFVGVGGDAVAAELPSAALDRTPNVVWAQRILAIETAYGAILSPDRRCHSPTDLIPLCEPHTGPPCDWERDVEPAIEEVLGSYLRKREFIKTLGVVKHAAIRNRDNRLTGMPPVDAEKAHERHRQANQFGAAGGQRREPSGITGALMRAEARRAARGETGGAGADGDAGGAIDAEFQIVDGHAAAGA